MFEEGEKKDIEDEFKWCKTEVEEDTLYLLPCIFQALHELTSYYCRRELLIRKLVRQPIFLVFMTITHFVIR